MEKNLENQLIIERYKFIQDKLKYLDSVLHANISLVVKLFVGIFSFSYGSFLIYLKQPDVLSPQEIVIILKLSSFLVFIISTIFLFMTISNVFSWFGYRHDEVELLKCFGGSFQRKSPRISMVFTWQETWFAIALIVILIFAFLAWMYAGDLPYLF